nr:amidohydrolase family protein [Bacteroidales bacterium]
MTKITDSPHHLWKCKTEDYGWMDDSMEILRKDYTPVDLKNEIETAGVDGTVVVQSRQTLEETEWLLDMADQYDFIKGVVGWVDLRSEDLEEQLETFIANPKFVGVRHVIHDEPDDDYMLKSRFRRGIELLSDYDLTYDLLLFPKHLQNAIELVNMFPGQRFVID